MYCSDCGSKAHGKFCSQCGNRIQTSDKAAVTLEVKDWEQLCDYETIMNVHGVRSAIAKQAANATQGVSGEAILAIYDKVVPTPIPMEKLAGVVQSLYAAWGVRTGQSCSEVLELPIGRAIAQALCALAKNAQTFLSADQHESGCVLTAELPSSVCSFKGKLMISLVEQVSGQGTTTHIAATTVIPGQLFDWGKSRRCLNRFFTDMRADLGLPARGNHRAVA